MAKKPATDYDVFVRSIRCVRRELVKAQEAAERMGWVGMAPKVAHAQKFAQDVERSIPLKS